MIRPSLNLNAARSWRDIPQEVAPRSMSREGRRRVVMGFIKLGVAIVVIGVVAWVGWSLLQTWKNDPAKLAAPVKSEPLRTIVWTTDGVLDLAWIEKQLALPVGVTLMELELPKLQTKLLADGQVRNAVLKRRFPDTLAVTLQERFPVGRLRVADRQGEESDYLISRDGVIFPGSHFQQNVIGSLPWLDGLKLTRSGANFAPVEGMGAVSDLVEDAQFNVPHLYKTWRIISLERFADDGEIVVRDAGGAQIIFGVRDTFFVQLAMLNDVMLKIAKIPDRTVASINLALGTHEVPVAFVPANVSQPRPQGNPAAPRSLESGGLWRNDRLPASAPPNGARITFPSTRTAQTRTLSRDL